MKKVITRFNLDYLLANYGKRDVTVMIRRLPEMPGSSYILNYDKLLAESKKLKCSGTHLINYIVLASFRDYRRYILDGVNTLPAVLCPLSKEDINNNPYIERHGKELKFLLEP